MQFRLIKYFLLLLVIGIIYSCNNSAGKKSNFITYKGIYSFGPEVKSFKDCDDGREFWVVDSSAQLELKYSQLNFEKPYEPVYVEVEGIKMHSDNEGISMQYDSTLIVKKVIKITADIPQDQCN